jgi:hypothetical protein
MKFEAATAMIAITVHCVRPPKAPIDRGSVEKPPGSVGAEPGRHGERQEGNRGESDVQPAEADRGLADPSGKPGLHTRSGELGLEQLPAAYAQPRKDGERDGDNADTAEPDRQLPPDPDRLRQGRDVGRHARTGGREAGHALEERVDRPAELGIADEHVRQRSIRRDDQPRDGDHEVALADADLRRAVRQTFERQPEAAHERPRQQERPDGFAVGDREDRRHERRWPEVLDQRRHEVERP